MILIFVKLLFQVLVEKITESSSKFVKPHIPKLDLPTASTRRSSVITNLDEVSRHKSLASAPSMASKPVASSKKGLSELALSKVSRRRSVANATVTAAEPAAAPAGPCRRSSYSGSSELPARTLSTRRQSNVLSTSRSMSSDDILTPLSTKHTATKRSSARRKSVASPGIEFSSEETPSSPLNQAKSARRRSMAYGEKVASAVACRRKSVDPKSPAVEVPKVAVPTPSKESQDTTEKSQPQGRPFKFHRGGRNNIPAELVAANYVLAGTIGLSAMEQSSDRMTGTKRGRTSNGLVDGIDEDISSDRAGGLPEDEQSVEKIPRKSLDKEAMSVSEIYDNSSSSDLHKTKKIRGAQ